MAVSKELLEAVKLYCKIDFDFEDSIVEEMIESAQEQICFAIEAGSKPEDFANYKKFDLTVKKQVKEDYEHRGVTADSNRYPLANGVLNIIHQLRLRGDDNVNT